MRWFGPSDPVALSDIGQAGCSGVVSALHHIPVGEVWEKQEIQEYKSAISAQGLDWTVVESLPVSEAIKTQSGQWRQHTEKYQQSIRNLAVNGIRVVTYNFMPILDWVRTDVQHLLPNKAEALYFNKNDYALFDLFMLKRPGAKTAYTNEEYGFLQDYYQSLSEDKKEIIYKNVLLGLPGSEVPFSPEQILQLLGNYQDISRDKLKKHLFDFLNAVCPIADEVGIQMAIHPDDPPFSVLGLPRIMSTAEDIADLMEAVPSPANGLCFCTGSLGARPDNDLLKIFDRWKSRVYFLHLRNTKRDDKGNFYEANHLDGDADMYAMMKAIVELMRTEQRSIPMRPDHGHKILDDLGKKTYPGYSMIGRLKGLAELRGLEYGIQQFIP